MQVTRTLTYAPDMLRVMTSPAGKPDPDRAELGLLALMAFAIAILCLVWFVVFGA